MSFSRENMLRRNYEGWISVKSKNHKYKGRALDNIRLEIV